LGHGAWACLGLWLWWPWRLDVVEWMKAGRLAEGAGAPRAELLAERAEWLGWLGPLEGAREEAVGGVLG